jgi:hypothetical protein
VLESFVVFIPPHLYEQRVAKAQLRDHLTEQGLWQRFVAIRESLKAQGVDAAEAWREAAVALESEMGDGSGKAVEGAERAPVSPIKAITGDISEDRVEKGMFIGKGCSTPETVEWVAANVMVGDVEAEDAPSPEAWGMLCWARRSNTNEAQFWGQIYTKLLPSRTSLEAEARYRDDGRSILNLIEVMNAELEEEDNSPEKLHQDRDGVPDSGGVEGEGPRVD